MEQEELKRTVKDFLNGHRKAILAFISEGNQPSVSLMLYVIDDELNFYFGTRKEFQKYERLLENNKVALAVVEEGINPCKVVQVQGTAEFIPEEKMKETLSFFESKNPSKYYVKDAPDFVMFKIHPQRMRLLDATNGKLVIENIEC